MCGFVGFASYFSIFFYDIYGDKTAAGGLTMVQVGYLVTIILTSLMMACLGMGNGSVFQIIPQRFTKEIGVVTGIVGAAGGLGGFLLPKYILGPLKESTGTHSAGFLAAAFIVLVAAVLFYAVTRSWKKTWATSESGIQL